MTEALQVALVVAAILAAIFQAIDHSKPTAHWVERRRKRYVRARALYEAAEAALAAHQKSLQLTEREFVKRSARRKKIDDRQTVMNFEAA